MVASTCSNNDPLNPYNKGFSDQCTWYAWERRHQVGQDLPSAGWGDAKNWTGNAIVAGYPTGVTPRVGAVLVCQPGACGGAYSFGHVAYVEQVVSPTSITISEENWAAPCVIDVRALDVGAGMTFIYNLSDPPPIKLDHLVYLPSVSTALAP